MQLTDTSIQAVRNLNWETPESRRLKSQLTMMFKILHGLVDIPADDYLTPASTRTRALHTKKLRQYASSTVQLLSSHYYHLEFFVSFNS